MSTGGDLGLVDVHLIGFPIPVFQRAQEHSDALMREFSLILLSEDHDVPRRLLALIEELGDQYTQMTLETDRKRDEALERGEQTVDLTYRVPAEVAPAARHLGELFDEADTFCRSGEHLLTMASTPEVVRFRRWFLDQFVEQSGGKPPVAWRDYRL